MEERRADQDRQEKLFQQWEPKVHSIIKRYGIATMSYEDAAQELREAILRCDKHWNPEYGVSFHTYLHTAMVRQLFRMKKISFKSSRDLSIDALELDFGKEDSRFDLLYGIDLSKDELDVLDMLLSGYKKKEIRDKYRKQANFILVGLQEKFMWLKT